MRRQHRLRVAVCVAVICAVAPATTRADGIPINFNSGAKTVGFNEACPTDASGEATRCAAGLSCSGSPFFAGKCVCAAERCPAILSTCFYSENPNKGTDANGCTINSCPVPTCPDDPVGGATNTTGGSTDNTTDNNSGPTVVGLGDGCTRGLAPQYSSVCGSGLICQASTENLVGGTGTCTCLPETCRQKNDLCDYIANPNKTTGSNGCPVNSCDVQTTCVTFTPCSTQGAIGSVCGSDGRSYVSPCDATTAGVTYTTGGACNVGDCVYYYNPDLQSRCSPRSPGGSVSSGTSDDSDDSDSDGLSDGSVTGIVIGVLLALVLAALLAVLVYRRQQEAAGPRKAEPENIVTRATDEREAFDNPAYAADILDTGAASQYQDVPVPGNGGIALDGATRRDSTVDAVVAIDGISQQGTTVDNLNYMTVENPGANRGSVVDAAVDISVVDHSEL